MSNKVKARIKNKYCVCSIADRSGIGPYHSVGPREGNQWFDWLKGETTVIDYNEWRWRKQKSQDILITGSVNTYGTYLDDVIGGRFF